MLPFCKILLRPEEHSRNCKDGSQHNNNGANDRKILLKPVVDIAAHQVATAGQFDQEIKDGWKGNCVNDLRYQRDLEEADIGHNYKKSSDQQLCYVQDIKSLAFLERIIQASGQAKKLCKGVSCRE